MHKLAIPLLACGLASALLCAPALAASSHGPGSRGFLPTCSGTFSNTNSVLQSNSFGTTPWLLAGNVVAAPTITSTTATAPDGTATASTLSIPTVTGAGAYSILSQPLPNQFPNYAYTNSIWVQNTTPGNGTASLIISDSTGTAFRRASVPGDGRWHQVSLLYPGSTYAASPYFEVGVDLRDTTQGATSGGLTLNIWHAQGTGGRGPGGNPWPYIATTTAAVTATQTVNCPPGVAFRDFSRLAPYKANPLLSENPSEAYQAGGISEPYVSTGGRAGANYYAMANGTDTTNHDDWYALSLYRGAHPYQWTEVTASNPVLQIPGSNYNTGTNGTSTNMAKYLLHPVYSPNGCTVSATFYAYCVYASAMRTDSHSAVFLAFSNNPAGPYTWYPNNTTPTPVVPFLPIVVGANYPSLPTVITMGGVNYMFVSQNDNGGLYTNLFTSPATDGVTWTFYYTAIAPPLGTDWDFDTIGVFDSWVIKTGCRFYEYYYTSTFTGFTHGGIQQAVGVLVSDDPRGPWFKYQGTIIPPTSPLYGGTPFLGDISAISINGQLILTGNYDNGTTLSRAVAASMPDACS